MAQSNLLNDHNLYRRQCSQTYWFLMFGNTAYFDFFPRWFGVILLFGYGAVIGYFFSLKPGRTAVKI